MQQVLYMSIQYEEKEEHFTEWPMEVKAKIFDECNVPTIKKYFDKHYAKIFDNKHLPLKFFVFCIIQLTC